MRVERQWILCDDNGSWFFCAGKNFAHRKLWIAALFPSRFSQIFFPELYSLKVNRSGSGTKVLPAFLQYKWQAIWAFALPREKKNSEHEKLCILFTKSFVEISTHTHYNVFFCSYGLRNMNLFANINIRWQPIPIKRERKNLLSALFVL